MSQNQNQDAAEVKDPLEELQAARAKRKADIELQRKAQLLMDLTAINALEEQLGDQNVVTLEVPYVPGLPAMIAAKAATPAHLKKYRAETKTRKDGSQPDNVLAAEAAGASLRIYPPRDEAGDARFQALFDARPGILVQLGTAALNRTSASLEEATKS